MYYLFLRFSGEYIGVHIMQKVDWEKIGIYIATLTAFIMFMNSIMDIKERIAKLEVKVEYIEVNRK